MAERFGPYVCPNVIDCGRLVDISKRDVEAVKAKSREDAKLLLKGIEAAHADWLKGHYLSGKALRRAGTPFRPAYDELERWLDETAPAKRPRAKNGFVYIVGMETDHTAVKIGFARKVADRLATLQTSSPHALRLLVAIRATQARERELHRMFAADHIRGEWFRRSQAVEEFIAENRSEN